MSMRLSSVTAILLAIVYGLVGLAGVSLHYLADSLTGDLLIPVPLGSHSLGSGSYMHSHSPDHHIHFHRSHHDHGKSQGAERDQSTADEEKGMFNAPHESHSEHACPLLTILSTLEIGLGSGFSTTVDFEALHAVLPQSAICHAFELATCHLARGPPVCAKLA